MKEQKATVHRAAKQVAILALVIFVAFGLVACDRNSAGRPNPGAADSTVAATVNDKKIMLNEVERVISQQAKGQQSQLSPLELAAARLQVLDGLIQQEVLLQRAEKEKLMPNDEEITQTINQQKRAGNFTEEEWQKALSENNQTEQSLREEVRKQIAVRKLQEKIVGQLSISDREVSDFYDKNKESFISSRGVALSAIAVDPRDNGFQDDAKSEAEAKAKIDRIYAQLKSGADFATVARASSEDPQSYLRGGEIGSATEEQLQQNGFPAALISRLFGPMQVGDITPPERSSNGQWYVFKLTGRQLESQNLNLDSPGVRDQIKQALINQRQTLLNAALVTTAMSESKVVNNLAMSMLNDPASLNSLRPVAAGSASPAAAASATPPAAAATPAAATASPTATATPRARSRNNPARRES